MRVLQKEIKLKPYKRGFHSITSIIENEIKTMDKSITGITQIFIKHTSASLALGEDADPSVRVDLEKFYSDMADDKKYFTHIYEGADDMPSHIKNSILGSSLSIPITNGKLNVGTWQGIYLCEHRDKASSRNIIITIIGE